MRGEWDAAALHLARPLHRIRSLFVVEMPAVLRCRYLSQEDLLAGRWADAVDALLAQDAPRERPRIDGAQIAAAAIVDLVS